MPVPCVIDGDLMDPSISALYKEGQDRNFDTYMQNFTYITERLLDQRAHIWECCMFYKPQLRAKLSKLSSIRERGLLACTHWPL